MCVGDAGGVDSRRGGMDMMQVDFGDGKPWGRGGGRARGVWVAMALIMVTGWIGVKKYENQKSVAPQTPQKTPEYIAPRNDFHTRK